MATTQGLDQSPRNSGQQVTYQDDCFTPKKALQRSPPSKPHTLAGKENVGVSLIAKRKPTCSNTKVQNRLRIVPAAQSKTRREKVTHTATPVTPGKGRESKCGGLSGAYEKQVQDTCFTPQKRLRRSPPPPTSSQTLESQDAFAIPPSSHRELPRTPINFTSESVGPSHGGTAHISMAPSLKVEGQELSPTSASTASNSVPTGNEIPPPSRWELPHTPPVEIAQPPSPTSHAAKKVPPTSHAAKKVPPTSHAAKKVLPTSHWELPRTPPVEIAAPPISHSATIKVLPTSNTHTTVEIVAPPTSHPQIPEAKDREATPTSHWELPRTPVTLPSKEVTVVTTHPSTSTIPTTPPTSHWELPHTPILEKSAILTPTSHQPPHSVSKPQHTSRRGVASTQPTVRHSPLKPAMLQHHPLCHSNRASPAVSSHITTHADTCSLPGLKCTEEDLAFLQHANNLKKYKAVQVRSEQLSRLEKVMVEEKEQLEQTSLKVKSDLDSMKTKYQEIVSSVTALISDPSLLPARVLSEHHLESTSSPQQGLSHASMTQLKKMKQLDAAQLEKTDTKLKAKLAELERTKQELQQRIRWTEEKDMQKRTELHTKIQKSLDTKLALKNVIETVAAENSSTKSEVENLQSKLAQLELSSIPENSIAEDNASAKVTEKQRAEERLKKIIYRCEMYVKRHQMLKEMGITKHTK